jgi:hypothetical protein
MLFDEGVAPVLVFELFNPVPTLVLSLVGSSAN